MVADITDGHMGEEKFVLSHLAFEMFAWSTVEEQILKNFQLPQEDPVEACSEISPERKIVARPNVYAETTESRNSSSHLLRVISMMFYGLKEPLSLTSGRGRT